MVKTESGWEIKGFNLMSTLNQQIECACGSGCICEVSLIHTYTWTTNGSKSGSNV